MDVWPDRKIRNNADWYIRKHATGLTWRYTRLETHDPELIRRSGLQAGELPIVTSHISDASWYALTTRRVVGTLDGQDVELAATDVSAARWGNFKGYGHAQTEAMVLVDAARRELRLEYEIGLASMAPIYYFPFWAIKYPVLDKLKDDPAAC
ncbi:MAG: hypothetical protein KDB14_14725 [Planctomycetales bacterium]|nr:hypothetical protein [Planctomycetales bacterium]